MDFLNQVLFVRLDVLPFYVLALVIGFTVHEFSHAYFANKFGDPTAKMLGRVTLNPAAHIDILGMILLLIAGFGWARPVPVNRANFDRPRLMSIVVSAAGPVSNLLIALVTAVIYYALNYFGVIGSFANNRIDIAIYTFVQYMILMNCFLFIFNLIPLPPLDGYRIVSELLPPRISAKLHGFEQWAFLLFLLIVFLPPLKMYTIQPLYELAGTLSGSFYSLGNLLFGG
ncbi:site-2 protease family protein [Paenibacillus hunanensis]|uniref:site-2 protease family protein n=1 Tax=Paenibacillus hunanensis TaxID=539262 RepID=UPI002A6B422D|nr:site-2 protease family protein [Paenibacillus hunanensis]WPP42779.1 site-2 protease family protein [Paenibacillus hunanensis]